MKAFTFTFKTILLLFISIAMAYGLFVYLNDQNQSAPDVTFTTIEGRSFKLSDLKGKMVIVNFWATSCAACLDEMPDLIRIYKDYHARGLEVVAVAMPYDPPIQVLTYTRRRGLPFPVMHDGFSEVSSRFNEVSLTPTTYLVDQQGFIIRRIQGRFDKNAVTRILNKNLGAPL